MLFTKPKFKDIKIIFAIISCKKNLNTKAKAVIETWAKELPENWDYYVFYGNLEQKNEINISNNIVSFKIDDSYNGLPWKEALAYKFIAKRHSCDYIVKCDDDVYLHINRLKETYILNDKYFGTKGHLNGSTSHVHGSFICINKKLINDELLDILTLDIGEVFKLARVENLLIHSDVRMGIAMKTVHNLPAVAFPETKFKSYDLIPMPDNEGICGHYIEPVDMYHVHKINYPNFITGAENRSTD